MNLIWLPAQLAVLAKVVDLNGFSAAARALGVPKASVSRAIADLERTLGTRVLERTTRRLSLTGTGRVLYPHASRLALETEAVLAHAARMRDPPARPLRVAADPTYGRVLLTPLVPRFLESFPQVPLEVVLEPGGLEDCDVALCTSTPQRPGIVERTLGSPPAVLCATAAYLEQRGTPSRPEDLARHDLLAPESGGSDLKLLLAHGAQRAEVRLSPKLRANDPAVLHSATAAGLGIGLLPEFLCRQGLATGKLRRVLAEWSLPPATALRAVYPEILGGDPRVRHFVDFIAANIVPALASA